MASAVVVRSARLDDLDSLSDLFEKYRSFYKQAPNRTRAKQYLTERFQRKDSVLYVAEMPEKGNILVGFAQLYPLLDSLKLGNKWLLNDLYVDPEARGTGLGKKLLARAKELAGESDATAVLLCTQKTNKIGNGLYPSQGWQLDEEFNHYRWGRQEWQATGGTGLVWGEGKAAA